MFHTSGHFTYSAKAWPIRAGKWGFTVSGNCSGKTDLIRWPVSPLKTVPLVRSCKNKWDRYAVWEWDRQLKNWCKRTTHVGMGGKLERVAASTILMSASPLVNTSPSPSATAQCHYKLRSVCMPWKLAYRTSESFKTLIYTLCMCCFDSPSRRKKLTICQLMRNAISKSIPTRIKYPWSLDILNEAYYK